MENSVACSFADYLCKRKIIKPELHEVYVYGTELVLSFIFTVLAVLIAGLIAGHIISSLVFLAVFILLRRFTGGYHADSYLKCKLVTVSVFLGSLLASTMIDVNRWMFVFLTIVGNMIIHYFAPVENVNKPLNAGEKKRFRKLSHLVFSLLSLCGLIIKVVTCFPIGILFYSLLSVIVLMIIPKSMKGEACDEEEFGKKDG
ncbi:MAG: accessory gene regulator B family protein [Clostridia bacterium]|nr:accessory gene regulator B family protein [Clostridia bacterium]